MKINYRKIWEEANGPIPVDEEGRTFHIHHIDGDRTNNELTNLKAVSVQDHYNIHLSQGDYYAAYRLGRYLSLDPKIVSFLLSEHAKSRTGSRAAHKQKHTEESKELMRKATLKRVENGTNAFLGGEIQRKSNRERVKNGTHHFLGGGFTGRKHKEETKIKQSLASKGKPKSPEHRAALSQARKKFFERKNSGGV